MTTPKAKLAGLALIAALCAGFTLGLAACAFQPQSSQELGVAVIAGDVAKVKALRSAGADPNAEVSFTRPDWNRGEEWNTRVLVAAIVYRHPKVVDLLLRHKVSFAMYHNAFAICPAVNSRQPQIVAALNKGWYRGQPIFYLYQRINALGVR